MHKAHSICEIFSFIFLVLLSMFSVGEIGWTSELSPERSMHSEISPNLAVDNIQKLFGSMSMDYRPDSGIEVLQSTFDESGAWLATALSVLFISHPPFAIFQSHIATIQQPLTVQSLDYGYEFCTLP